MPISPGGVMWLFRQSLGARQLFIDLYSVRGGRRHGGTSPEAGTGINLQTAALAHWFRPSDWPSWIDFVGGKFKQCILICHGLDISRAMAMAPPFQGVRKTGII